ncbi:MAG: TIGR02186 family protein [Alphaproteobacteria bacterium]
MTALAFAAALLSALALTLPARPAAAQPLAADVSSHLIAVTTGFTGTDVVLFGATDGPGDVVVLVRGPERQVTVRRKDRVGGFWINVERIVFDHVPAFFALAANRPIAEFTSPAQRHREQLGPAFLRVEARTAATPQKIDDYRAALIRNKIADGLYATATIPVRFLGERLFRATIRFPADVPTGTYTVDVLMYRDGEVVAAQATPLIVSKIGVGADIADFAYRHTLAYGLVAVALAAVAGWLAGIIFRRA